MGGDVKVDQYFSWPGQLGRPAMEALWDALKSQWDGLWTVGSAFALAADLLKYTPARIISFLTQADSYGRDSDMAELAELERATPTSSHSHEGVSDKV